MYRDGLVHGLADEFGKAVDAHRTIPADVDRLTIDALRIDLAYGKTDAKYDELVGVTCPCGDKLVATDLDFDKLAPWTASIAATWTTTSSGGGTRSGAPHGQAGLSETNGARRPSRRARRSASRTAVSASMTTRR